jgi:RNA polymerase sigma factor (sigma-70 family)
LLDDNLELLSRCLKKDVSAEYQLYRHFAPKMYGICLRYGGNENDAAEILQLGFIRLFNNLYQYRYEGNLEGWVQRIFVTTAINYYKQQLKFNQHVELNNASEDATLQEDSLSIISVKELLAIIQSLPPGYRTIFSMHEIEGYGHKEIAGLLGIAEGTSKSQLHLARQSVMRILREREQENIIG